MLDGRPDQRSFGGIDMTVRRNAFGRQVDSFEAPVTLDGIDGGAVPRRLHPRAVGRAGRRAVSRCWAGVDGADRPAGRIVAVRQGNLLATPSTPSSPATCRVHRYFVEMVQRR